MREITIAGGGLAGLALGLFLRRDQVPVILHEAASYPRHRVCGEFISGKGALICNSLLQAHDHRLPSRTVRFFAQNRASRIFNLPDEAISISRFDLDSTLARTFQEEGGDLRQHSRWNHEFSAPGLVRATGRRPARNASNRLVGIKIHATDLSLSADLELHFSRGCYVGLSRLPRGEINICGLFNFQKFRSPPQNLSSEFRDLIAPRLADPTRFSFINATFDQTSFCAVAGLSLKPESSSPSGECRIGDTFSMIAPFTGNGMSIAFESALSASRILVDYSKGLIEWEKARALISQSCENQFAKRLRRAFFLQNCVIHPIGQWLLLSSLKTSPALFPAFFNKTRC